jgi:TPR repeat protein
MRTFIPACLLLLASAHVEAVELDAMATAIADGRAQSIVADLIEAAEGGDTRARTMLAELYQRGEGVARNAERAVQLYRLAADQGDAEAQFNLGNMYLLGEGVEPDEAWAMTYYRQAAAQGHELAARNMEQLYKAAGIEAPDNSDDAAPDVLEHQAAEPRVTKTAPIDPEPLAPTTRLGGTEAGAAPRPQPAGVGEQPPVAGVDPDELEAIRLAREHGIAIDMDGATEPAAPAGRLAPATAVPETPPSAATPSAATAEDGDSTPVVASTQNDAAEVLRLDDVAGAAVTVAPALAPATPLEAAGDPQAQFELANRYLAGDGVQPDEAMAITLYREAARAGHEPARERLSSIYADAGLPMPDLARPRESRPAASTTREVAEAHGPAATEVQAAPVTLDESAAVEPMTDAAMTDAAMADETMADAAMADAAMNDAAMADAAMADAAMSDAAMSDAAMSDAAMADETMSDAAMSDAAMSDAAMSDETMADETMADETMAEVVTAGAAAQPQSEPYVEQRYRYAVVQHGAAPQPSPDEINPPPPANHRVIGGGELAQSRLPAVAAAAGVDVAMDAAREQQAAATAAGAEVLASAEPVAQATETEVTAPALAAAGVALAEAVTATTVAEVDEATPAPAPAPLVAQDDSPGDEPGLLGRLKERIVADGEARVARDSRAPGATSAASTPQSTSDVTAKLAIAAAAEPAPPTVKPTLADAKAALNAGDFATAAAMFTELADDGDAEAQAHIGYMTYQGEGVGRDRAKAVEWYRRSAVQGNRDAQYNLAVAYAFGEGVPQDEREAVTWYRRAAEQGSAIAQYSLGVSYALGEGVEQSDAEAARWYGAAAAQGYPAAQYNLAYMFRAGKGLEQSDTEALRWFLQAAQNGHASAQYSLGYMYRSGKGVTRNLDEALRWYRLAAAQGHPEARADLATLEPGS